MKITLITVCFHSELTIRETFDSVLKQTFKNYEYLIIDGKSKDKTLEIIKEYEPRFHGKLKWISEKDRGLYDAMNKGIQMATGDIIGILNSDDILASHKTLEMIEKAFNKYHCDGTYSDLEIRDEKTMSQIIRKLVPKIGNYKLGWYPPHPTLYLKRDVYQKHGFYNQSYPIAADYDFMLRVMKDSSVSLFYIPKTLVYMRSGGISTNGVRGYYQSFCESYLVLRKNKIRFPFLVNLFRTFQIFFQLLGSKFLKRR